MIYLILSIIIILVLIISYFVIKKLIKDKKSLQFKLDFADNQIEDLNTNKTNYLKIIKKLSEKAKENDIFKEDVDNSTGAALAALANSM